jgi:hypothetical protein
MDRFKWFDFLGALILLFSVTKSALALQGEDVDPSEISRAPSEPVGQVGDSFRPLSKDASEFEDDFLIFSLMQFVDWVSRSPRIQDAIVVEMIRYYEGRSLLQALTKFFILEYQERENPIHPGFIHAHSFSAAPIFIR